MPTQHATNFQAGFAKPFDTRNEPQATISDALSAVRREFRYCGLTILILSEQTEFWFRDGIEDHNFVKKELVPDPTGIPFSSEKIVEIQDFAIGKKLYLSSLDPIPQGWLPCDGSEIDPDYDLLISYLNSNTTPMENAPDGMQAIIKAQILSTVNTVSPIFHDAFVTPYGHLTGSQSAVQSALRDTLTSCLNTLFLQINQNEHTREEINRTLGHPSVATDNFQTVQTVLHGIHDRLDTILRNRSVTTLPNDSLSDLVNKVDQIAQSSGTVLIRPIMPIGSTVRQEECPGPGWEECNGRTLNDPQVSGEGDLEYPAFYRWHHGNHTVPININPEVVATPTMTGLTTPYNAMTTNINGINSLWKCFRRDEGVGTGSYAPKASVPDWSETAEPVWIEYEFSVPVLVTAFRFSMYNSTTAYNMPTEWQFQGYQPDNDEWTTLASASNYDDMQIGLISPKYKLTNTEKYKRYRWRISRWSNGSNTSYSFYFDGIWLFTTIPYHLPQSLESQKSWIKVESIGDDSQYMTEEYVVDSPQLSQGDLGWMTSQDSVCIGLMNSVNQVGRSATITGDLIRYHETYITYSSLMGTSPYHVGRIFRRDSTASGLAVVGTLTVTNSYNNATFPRFVTYRDRLYLFHDRPLRVSEYNEETRTFISRTISSFSPGTSYLAVMAQSDENNECLFYYLCGTNLTTLTVYQYDIASNTMERVLIGTGLPSTAFTKATFVEYEGNIYLFASCSATQTMIYVYRVTPDGIILLASKTRPGTGDVCWPTDRNRYVSQDGYLYALGETLRTNETEFTANSERLCNIVRYHFRDNRFEFLSLAYRRGVDVAPPTTTLLSGAYACTFFEWNGKLYLDANTGFGGAGSNPNLLHIDLDAGVIRYDATPQHWMMDMRTVMAGGSSPMYIFNVYPDELIGFSLNYYLLRIPLSLPNRHVKKYEDAVSASIETTFTQAGSMQFTPVVALETGTEGQTVNCARLLPDNQNIVFNSRFTSTRLDVISR